VSCVGCIGHRLIPDALTSMRISRLLSVGIAWLSVNVSFFDWESIVIACMVWGSFDIVSQISDVSDFAKSGDSNNAKNRNKSEDNDTECMRLTESHV